MRALVLLLLLAPLVQAGTDRDPEIRDDASDVGVSVLLLPADDVPAGPPPEALDIVASWFHDETHESISVTMKVADLSRVDEWDDPMMGFIRWGTRFELSNHNASTDDYWENTWIMGIDLNNGPVGWRASLDPPTVGGELQPRLPATFDVDLEAGLLTVTVARGDLGSPMAGDAMHETLSLHDARWGPGPYAVNYQDQSPDGTYPSRDYVFALDTGGPADPEPVPAAEPTREAPVPVFAVFAAVALAMWRRR